MNSVKCDNNSLSLGLLETGDLGSVNSQPTNHINRLCHEAFGHILSFLGTKELGQAEGACKVWNRYILADRSDQWKVQFEIRLGLPPGIASREYLPAGLSYKQAVQFVFPSLLDKRVYEHYIGKIGPVSPPPKDFFKKWNESDPCDPTKTIGKAYVLMYCPDYIESDLSGFSLDGVDDPNNLQAPKLIQSEEGFEATSENTTLKVPVTINNIVELFKRPKIGNASKYSLIWESVVEQHGNKRMSAGWMCMRIDVIGEHFSFAAQQTLAMTRGVVLSELLPRILFNFTQHARVNVYPDRRDPLIHARTSTLTRDSSGNDFPASCGAGSADGLIVTYRLDRGSVGVAVALPVEVQELAP